MSNQATQSRVGLLKITEIFYSLQGEARDAGKPTVFIRLTGCPLRCVYCDSEYAFYGGEWIKIDQIMEQVASYRTSYVCVTGGEPLAQKRCNDLLSRLCEADYEVSLETGGATRASPKSRIFAGGAQQGAMCRSMASRSSWQQSSGGEGQR